MVYNSSAVLIPVVKRTLKFKGAMFPENEGKYNCLFAVFVYLFFLDYEV